MRIARHTVLIAMLCGAVMSSGCALFLIGAGVAAGAGTVAYVAGELKTTEETSFERAWKASLRAMDDLEFKVTKSEKDAVTGRIVAHGANDKVIKVLVRRQTDTLTEIRIRVNTFGDESLSRLVLEKIKKRL